MNTFDRITIEPGKMGGRACIRRLRITVAHVVNLVANGMTPQEIIADHPDLVPEDIRQALQYAASLASGDEVHILTGT
jgi:uncharacterized protein (DUF433 family)